MGKHHHRDFFRYHAKTIVVSYIYINDLSDGLSSKAKLFADNGSLFSGTHDTNTSASEQNKKRTGDWAFEWKMNFNLDPNKQTQEVIFSRKLKKVPHPPLIFNNTNVSQCKSQKHLGIILDCKLTIEEHCRTLLSKTYRTIGLLRKLRNFLPRAALITIDKTFVRSHLDYGDVLFDQAFNPSFHEKLESLRYTVCLALTGTIRAATSTLVQKAPPFL